MNHTLLKQNQVHKLNTVLQFSVAKFSQQLCAQVDVTLSHQSPSGEDPAADENRFELVLKKQKGVAVGSFGILQIPISFKAQSLEESCGQVQVVMDGASVSGQNIAEPLLWQYPIKVRWSTEQNYVLVIASLRELLCFSSGQLANCVTVAKYGRALAVAIPQLSCA